MLDNDRQSGTHRKDLKVNRKRAHRHQAVNAFSIYFSGSNDHLITHNDSPGLGMYF